MQAPIRADSCEYSFSAIAVHLTRIQLPLYEMQSSLKAIFCRVLMILAMSTPSFTNNTGL